MSHVYLNKLQVLEDHIEIASADQCVLHIARPHTATLMSSRSAARRSFTIGHSPHTLLSLLLPPLLLHFVDNVVCVVENARSSHVLRPFSPCPCPFLGPACSMKLWRRWQLLLLASLSPSLRMHKHTCNGLCSR